MTTVDRDVAAESTSARAPLPAVLLTIAAAFALWCVMFYLRAGDFWWSMTGAAGGLAVVSLVLNRGNLGPLFSWRASWIVWGLCSAAALYLVFWVGDFFARQFFAFAPEQIGGIYGLRAGESPLKIGLLLFFVIGPAEEIYWRGFLQNSLQKRLSTPLAGWLAAGLIYAFVHIWAFNFILLMAALLCGLFWGLLFYLTRNLWPGIISHAVWDVFVFLILPIGR
ncbi:MAG: type II CAAX endopeptidase family protein [Gemmatimonadales bacterium]|jgi:hypothetical protein